MVGIDLLIFQQDLLSGNYECPEEYRKLSTQPVDGARELVLLILEFRDMNAPQLTEKEDKEHVLRYRRIEISFKEFQFRSISTLYRPLISFTPYSTESIVV